MKIKEVISCLESLAPIGSQESYDNVGLLVGDESSEVTGVLVSLDVTEEIVLEAIQKGCNLLVAHHPVLFKGIKRLSGKDFLTRTLLMCVKNEIAVYAIHTNLDNSVLGVNWEIGKRLGLNGLRILSPKSDVLTKLVVFVPENHLEQVRSAAFAAGAGRIGKYEECHFSSEGIGTFKPLVGAQPFTGEVGKRSAEMEIRMEFLVSKYRLSSVVQAVIAAHPYEEVAYDCYSLLNKNQEEGSGMYGELSEPMDPKEFLAFLKEVFKCGTIRHTAISNRKIKRVAFCGGSGVFLLDKAKQIGADIFITGDVKYHDFFEADGQILLADIGHFESEQYTSDLLVEYLKKNFTTFAVHLTEINTNPINYY